MAVRVQRGDVRETVAYLQPPDVIGELSVLTNRTCVADVEVMVDADVVYLPKDALKKLPAEREAILRGLLHIVIERLQNTVAGGARVKSSPVISLHNLPHWEAPHTFARELTVSLAQKSGQETLLVNIGGMTETEEVSIGERAWMCGLPGATADAEIRSGLARRLTFWKSRFTQVVLNPIGPRAGVIADVCTAFVDLNGYLAGPGDPIPDNLGNNTFVIQSAAEPTLPLLDGRHQLIWEGDESEKANLGTARFRRVVESIARHILGIQVGIALGGGAAWGWAHIGVLEIFEKAGLPIDVISGCSMGSVIGALRCAGFSVPEMLEIANYWKSRTRKFIEWRFWRMTLLNEGVVLRTFRKYWNDRTVNTLEIPYWANAVDLRNGKEFSIRDGEVVNAVRASISLPGLLPPYTRDRHLLVDAGIMDPVPVRLAKEMGASFTVAVNAMAKLEATEVDTRPAIGAFDVMLRCTRIMGHEIGQARAEETAQIVLTPSFGNITMLQFARAPETVDCGRRVAEQHLEAVLDGYERVKALAAMERPQPVEQNL
jgi:NTE family protein